MYAAKLISSALVLAVGTAGLYSVSGGPAPAAPGGPADVRFQNPVGPPQPQPQLPAGVNCYLPDGSTLPLVPMPGGWYAGAGPGVTCMAYRVFSRWWNPATMMEEITPAWFAIVDSAEKAYGWGPDGVAPVVTGYYNRLKGATNTFERVSFTVR